MFQQYSLYPHLSVYDNLAFPLRSPLRRMPEAEIRTRVTEIARAPAHRGQARNPATRLSGGQMQRVAIGRALVRRPSIYLMDEPLSSLDAKLRADLRLELVRIQQELGATILYVTHDQTEAMTMADRIGVMDAGRLVQVGTPREIYEDPATTYVATRLGNPGDQPAAARPRCRDLAAPGATERSARGPSTCACARRRTGRERGGSRCAGSSISATRTTCTSPIGDRDFVTLADPAAALAVGDRSSRAS